GTERRGIIELVGELFERVDLGRRGGRRTDARAPRALAPTFALAPRNVAVGPRGFLHVGLARRGLVPFDRAGGPRRPPAGAPRLDTFVGAFEPGPRGGRRIAHSAPGPVAAGRDPPPDPPRPAPPPDGPWPPA